MNVEHFKGRIIDLMMNIPGDGIDYKSLDPLLGKKRHSETSSFPAAHLFTDRPQLSAGVDPAAYVIEEMARFGIRRSLIDVTNPDGLGRAALRSYPDRFIGCFTVDPNKGMGGLKLLGDAVAEGVVSAVAVIPAFYVPQIPINDARLYPFYARCCELGIPVFITVGAPGPRVPMAPQKVELLDDVCWYFQDLKLVMRHGAEPWADVAVKLMRRWPNLSYSTSAYSPRRYPAEIINYLRDGGERKIMYAGYFPIGLKLDRIFAELTEIDLDDARTEQFLFANAIRLLGLSDCE